MDLPTWLEHGRRCVTRFPSLLLTTLVGALAALHGEVPPPPDLGPPRAGQSPAVRTPTTEVTTPHLDDVRVRNLADAGQDVATTQYAGKVRRRLAVAGESLLLRPIVVTVRALDRAGLPVEGARIHALNQEYWLRRSAETDSNGVATIKALPGTWSFFATLGWELAEKQRGHGYAPWVLDRRLRYPHESVVLQPDSTVSIDIANLVPGFDGEWPTAAWLIEPRFGRALSLNEVGTTIDGHLEIDVVRGSRAQITLSGAPGLGPSGFQFLSEEVALDGTVRVRVDPQGMGKLHVATVDDSGRPETTWLLTKHFQRDWGCCNGTIWEIFSGPKDLYLSPGDYLLVHDLFRTDGNDPRAFRIAGPEQALSVHAGDAFDSMLGWPSKFNLFVAPKPAPWASQVTQLFIEVLDQFGGNLGGFYRQGQCMPFHAVIWTPAGRRVEGDFKGATCTTLELPAIFEPEENPRYEISWDLGPFGKGGLQGGLYDTDINAMHNRAEERTVPQSPAIKSEVHGDWVAFYERIAKEMEDLLGVPTDCRLGVMEGPAHNGYEDVILPGFIVPTEMEIQASPSTRFGQFFHAHEEGHGRNGKAPSCFFAIRTWGEMYVTLISLEATARVANDPSYIEFLYGSHDYILDYLHGGPNEGIREQGELVQFTTWYLRRNYGFDLHRRMILEWSNAFMPARRVLDAQGFTDLEQFAGCNSWLAGGENLAWLYRGIGYELADSRVEAAMNTFRDVGLSSGGIALALGDAGPWDNGAHPVCDRVSVPIMIRSTTAAGFDNIAVELAFDPSVMNPVAIYKRDLTFSDAWTVNTSRPEQGRLAISLVGTSPVKGLGSVAQVNFEIVPGLPQGAYFVAVASAQSTATPVTWTEAVVRLGDTPTIRTLPPLPTAIVGQVYGATLQAHAGAPPYRWSVVRYSLPPGLSLDADSGAITGSPTAVGKFDFRVEVEDAAGKKHIRRLCMDVTEPGGGIPAVSVGDVTIQEGDVGTSHATFVVRLSGPSSHQVTVEYMTSDGSAEAGNDYLGVAGKATFQPGQTSQTVEVETTADEIPEADEVFYFTLRNPTNAVLGDHSHARCTVINDDSNPAERAALIALYNATNGPAWKKNTGWLGPETTECTWFGVSCDTAGRVTGINLDLNNLAGTVPSELANLSKLTSLSFAGNQLTGGVPDLLGSLSKLTRIDLNWNRLSGAISPAIGGLTNLEYLYLDGNQLAGAIPAEFGRLSNLQELNLNFNSNLDPGPIPDLHELSSLRWFWMNSCNRTGPLPPWLGSLRQLSRLDLGQNSLSGPIPREVGTLAALTEMSLVGNQLAGAIPNELVTLSGLRDTGSDLRWNALHTSDAGCRRPRETEGF